MRWSFIHQIKKALEEGKIENRAADKLDKILNVTYEWLTSYRTRYGKRSLLKLTKSMKILSSLEEKILP